MNINNINMEGDIRQRIIDILNEYHTNPTKLSGEDKAMQKRLSRQLKGGATITFETLSTIVNAFPELSIEWLIKGEGEMIRQDVKQSGWGNINTSSGNVSVEKIVQNDHSVNIALPEKGFQKIINSDGSETTIEAHSFDMDKIAQIEAENKKLREKLEHLDSVLHENSVLKDRIMELQTRLITLLSPKTND